MTFLDRLRSAYKDQRASLGRHLTVPEVVELACGLHEQVVKEAKKERRKSQAAPEAEQVYALYPRKINPEDAKVAITHALKKRELGYLLDKTNQFREAVESWPSSYRYKQDGRDLCPYPASWFNSGGYDSDPKEWKRHGARSAAPHQHVSPPEPPNWQKAVPEYVRVNDPWTSLPPADQAFIIQAVETANFLSATPNQVEHEQRLRNA